MLRSTALLPAALLCLAVGPLSAQNCQNTSTGRVPIDDLGAGLYQGFQGGLYPGGANARPAAHEAAGLAQSALVVPRDAAGNPDPVGGKIVFVSIGMSNTRNHWQQFMPLSNADPERNPRVVLVQGAQGGQSAGVIADPGAAYWSYVDQAVANAGATNAQVQVIWFLQAHAGPTLPFPGHAQALRDDFVTILQIVRDRFPNARIAYLASRIYAGYATTGLNPEPYAYEQGFSCKWTIEQQIGGDPALNYDPSGGAVEAPWLSWGIYTWADGLVPRSDGLTWECSDFANDGTHPNPQGSTKVATRLHAFLKQDPVAVPWYLDPDPPVDATFCAGDGTATACPCGNAGSAGRGCENSFATGGGRLLATGTASVTSDTVVLTAAGLPPTATALFVQATEQAGAGSGVVLGDGLLCLGGTLRRLGIQPASGGLAQYPQGNNPPVSVRGQIPPAGATRHYQVHYRNAAAFCTPETFNLTNGYSLVWVP